MAHSKSGEMKICLKISTFFSLRHLSNLRLWKRELDHLLLNTRRGRKVRDLRSVGSPGGVGNWCAVLPPPGPTGLEFHGTKLWTDHLTWKFIKLHKRFSLATDIFRDCLYFLPKEVFPRILVSIKNLCSITLKHAFYLA